MEGKFYALYDGTDVVLVFGTSKERDEYVKEEKIVHPECRSVSDKEIQNVIKGKIPVYDNGFGCMIIL